MDELEPDKPTAAAPLMRPWVAIFLAVANVAAFGWELSAGADAMRPTAGWMLDHGGNYGPLTFAGEQWRLLTSMFLHYGVLHLVMNMIGLLDGGRHVERMYGHAGFAALYLVSGLAGSFASAIRANAISAGASGAVFGIFGAFGAFLLLHRNRLDKEQVSHQARGLLIFLAYNIWFGVTAKGIDIVAHAGGLAAGFVCGLALELGTNEKHSSVARALLVGVLGTALVFGGAVAAPAPTNPMAVIDNVSAVEEKTLARWNALVGEAQADKLTDEQFADAIEKELLPPWRGAQEEYAKSGSGPLKADMLEYLAARAEGWEIMIRGLRAHDEAVMKEGMTKFSQGDAIVERMKAKAAGN
jgi:rhomboid protease GluP